MHNLTRSPTLGRWMAMIVAVVVAVVALVAMPGLSEHAAYAAHQLTTHAAAGFGSYDAASSIALFGIGQTAVRDLKTVLTEMEGLQTEYKGKAMPQSIGDKWNALGAEAKAIQDEMDREAQLLGIRNIHAADLKSREVPNPALPASKDQKAAAGSEDEIVGFLRIGAAYVRSSEYKHFLSSGMPRSESAVFEAKNAQIDTGIERKAAGRLIPVTRKMLEQKAPATIGATVIRADRLAEVVRFAERDRLTLRDLVLVQSTNSASIDYVTISAVTRAAAPVAESAAKPEATLTLGSATAPVRTIATWMPITEQQLQDVPQLEGIIDEELMYDLSRVEEDQILWGDGTGQNLLGIFPTPGVGVGRTVGGDTLIDMIRRMMTDIAIAGLDPNGLVIDPLDWESVVLAKGSDLHYLYQVFPDTTGALRVWGLLPVETVAARNPAGNPTTRERRALVGDFRRGATLWDRMQKGVAVGYINDQFIKNQRTIRAEERLAFGVKRPPAFKYRITQALVP